MIKDRLRAIKEGLKGIKSIKRLRLSLNGFSNLKRSHNLSLWRNTKTLLLELFPLPPNCRYSKHIFQHSFPSAEMVIHQYVSDLTLKLWFGNRLLIAYSRESKKVSWPLPKIWVNQLINQNIPVNCLLSRIYFGFLVIGVFFLNLIQSFLLIFNFKKQEIFVNSVYFNKLNRNNYLYEGKEKEFFNLVTWFIYKYNLSKNINRIIVGDDKYFSYKDDNVEIQNAPPPFRLRLGLLENLQYCAWLLWAVCICLYDLLLFRWWHALVLLESSKAKIVCLLKKESLSNGYYFHWSGRMLRPMWTYTVESFGKDVVLYFYSLSEQPQILGNSIARKADFWLLNWPVNLYWTSQHQKMMQLSMREKTKGLVVGPIWFRDSEEEVSFPSTPFVSVFCSEYYRKAFYIGSSTMVEYFEYNPNLLIRFVDDIAEVCSELNILIVHKRKRSEGRRGLKNYNNKLRQLESQKYIMVDGNISPLRIIGKSLGVVSFPFTSVPQYAHTIGVPAAYYDPSGTLSRNDPAAQGTEVLRSKEELRGWLTSLK